MMDVASVATAPRNQKRKTYGKRTAATHQAFAHFADSPQKPKATPSTWSPSPSPEPAKVVSPLSKPTTGKLKRPSPKRPRDVDMFDVPTSDGEHSSSPGPQKRPTSPLLQLSQRRLDSPCKATASRDGTSDDGNTMVGKGKRKRDPDAAEAQLMQENAAFQRRTQTTALPIQPVKPKVDMSRASTKPTTKNARGHSPPVVRHIGAGKAKSRLRAGHPSEPRLSAPVVVLGESSSPARLEKMVHAASEDVEQPRRDVEPTSNKRPRSTSSSSSGPRTPPRVSGSPASITSITRSGSATPRQNELWSKLLGKTNGTNSPSRLAVDQLRISSSTKNLASSLLPRSISDIGPPTHSRRGRLIDKLAKNNIGASAGADTDEDESMADDSSELETTSTDHAAVQQVEAEIAAASINQGPSKVTYGQVRSYVEDSGLEADLMLESPIVPIKPVPKSTYGSRAQASQSAPAPFQDNSEDNEESQGPIKSVHELRAKGESRRFADDFENLLEDIQYRNSASWSRQRSGIMELCEKLSDKQYVSRMVDAGLDERLLRACSGVSDGIFNFVVAANVALIGSAEVSLTVLRHIQQSDCFDMLFKLVPLEMDVKLIAKERKSNMSKVAQNSFAEFCGKLTSGPLFADRKPPVLSPHVLALRAIEVVVRRMRRLGHMDDLLDEQKTSDLLQVLERRVTDRVGPHKYDEQSLELALSTLEAGSVIPGRIQSAWTPKRMDRLAKVLPDILDPKASNATVLTPLALRLMLNLTNGKASASATFADARLVRLLVSEINDHFRHISAPTEPDLEEEAAVDDRLILSLGAMINLAEFSDSARAPLVDEHQNLLHGLVDTFLKNRGKAADADSLALTASNVAYGYLAVLLGNLCENTEVKHAVAAKLPDGNLVSLVDAIDEFVAYNKVADRSAYDSEEGGKVWRVFTERLANVAEKLREE